MIGPQHLFITRLLLLVATTIIPRQCRAYNRPYQYKGQTQHQQSDHLQQQQQSGGGDDGINLLTYIEAYLTPLEHTINKQLFLTQLYEQSKIYKFHDLLAALPVVYDGIAGSKFYFGESNIDLGWEYGLVNLAAFLGKPSCHCCMIITK